MPGYPLSAMTVIREIIAPLAGGFGLPLPLREKISARLTATLHSDIGTTEFCPPGRRKHP
jgi:putative molybdopterin biosynthesis protein